MESKEIAMATERRDGTWTDVEPINKALATFIREANVGTSKAFHIGTPEEIEVVQKRRSIEERLSVLEAAIPIQSNILKVPDQEDIKKYGDQGEGGVHLTGSAKIRTGAKS